MYLLKDGNLLLFIIRNNGDGLCTADVGIESSNLFEFQIGGKISTNMGLLLELGDTEEYTNLNTNFTSQTKLQKLICYKSNDS